MAGVTEALLAWEARVKRLEAERDRAVADLTAALDATGTRPEPLRRACLKATDALAEARAGWRAAWKAAGMPLREPADSSSKADLP